MHVRLKENQKENSMYIYFALMVNNQHQEMLAANYLTQLVRKFKDVA